MKAYNLQFGKPKKAQLAYLYAKVNNCKRIIFGGFFIRGHAATMHTISFGVNYWSKLWFIKLYRILSNIM